MTIDPSTETVQNVYKLLIGSIVPRPIAFVSSIDAHGIRNLAPFSFFTVASANPPVVCFAPMVRPGAAPAKDTLRNIRDTGEFVVNIVSEDFGPQMNLTAGEYPPDVDEFVVAGLTPVKSDLVRPDRVGESKVQMECRLLQILDVSTLPMGGSVVFGEVLRFHVADEVVDSYRIDPTKLRAIGRMGGAAYARTTGLFEMERPK